MRAFANDEGAKVLASAGERNERDVKEYRDAARAEMEAAAVHTLAKVGNHPIKNLLSPINDPLTPLTTFKPLNNLFIPPSLSLAKPFWTGETPKHPQRVGERVEELVIATRYVHIL